LVFEGIKGTFVSDGIISHMSRFCHSNIIRIIVATNISSESFGKILYRCKTVYF